MKRVLALALLLFSALTYAAYPERSITMLIAYPPGGGTDLVGRALGPFIENGRTSRLVARTQFPLAAGFSGKSASGGMYSPPAAMVSNAPRSVFSAEVFGT